jgi:hypothetical protein
MNPGNLITSGILAGSVLMMTLPVGAQDLPNGDTRFTGLSPQVKERVVCSISAAVKYQIPANIMLAVAEIEDGKPGQWVLNTNGTHDVGPMQFNTSYLAGLARYGITASDVAAAGCYPYDLAAWRLRQHIRHDAGDLWTRAANYHSRTYSHNKSYRAVLMVKAGKWADWLGARFIPYEEAKPQAVRKPQVARNSSLYVPRKIIVKGHP